MEEPVRKNGIIAQDALTADALVYRGCPQGGVSYPILAFEPHSLVKDKQLVSRPFGDLL